jgi:CBS domain-containing protein
MAIGTICSRVVATASARETVEAGARRMKEYDVGTLVVAEEDRQPQGIVTDRDVIVRCVAEGLDPSDTALSEVMTSPVRTLHEASPMDEALEVMSRIGARRLVVTDDDGSLAGILSLDDVISSMAEQMNRVGGVVEKQSREVLKGR